MSENIVPFNFEGKEVRFVGTFDRPEWIAQDVCDCLGLGNVSKALMLIPDSEKGITKGDTLGGKQDMATVLEPGFYRLVFKSRKPAARRFQDWVFGDVLPQIRRTGTYSASAVDRLTAENQKLKEKRQSLMAGVPSNAMTLGAIAKQHDLKVEQLLFVLAENGRTDVIKTFARVGEYHRILKDHLEDINRMVQEYKDLNDKQISLF